MIKGFEPPHPAEPVRKNGLQAMPIVASGFITGLILLIVPHASPWEGITPFMPAVVGRILPAAWGIPAAGVIAMHLALSILYGFLISLAAMNFRELRAVVAGGIAGFVLYLVNLGVVSAWLPQLRGGEVPVLITHVVFGLLAAGLYRGLLRRKVPVA